MLHTDDLAWHHGVFAWDELLRDAVLPVVRAGEPLDYRPPQWQARSRPGSITLPGGLAFLVVEGVGASQASVRDRVRRGHLGGDRRADPAGPGPPSAGGRGDVDTADYASWMAEENAYITRERPWEHADLLVNGGDSIPHDLTGRPRGRLASQPLI